MVREVQTELVYSARTTNDKKKHWVEGGVSNPRSNFEEERHLTKVVNLASNEIKYRPSLEVNGFEIAELRSNETEFKDESKITSEYYKEIENFLLDRLKASEIVIFDHTIRRPNTSRGPVPRTHVDQTEKAAIARVKRHAQDRLQTVGQKRFQLINVWRPISHPAWNNPLAFCDYQTLGTGDMIETDRIDFSLPDQPPGETYSVAHNPGQSWYYHKDLTIDQVVLIKCYDSDTSGGKVKSTNAKNEMAKYSS